MCTQSKLKLWLTDSTDHSLNTAWWCFPLHSITPVLWPDWCGPAPPLETSLLCWLNRFILFDGASPKYWWRLTSCLLNMIFWNYGAAERIRTNKNRTEQNLTCRIVAAKPHYLLLIIWRFQKFKGNFLSIKQMLERVFFCMTLAVKRAEQAHYIIQPFSFLFIVCE